MSEKLRTFEGETALFDARQGIPQHTPLRAPHHTTPMPRLTFNLTCPQYLTPDEPQQTPILAAFFVPGEVMLAYGGVMLLDQLPRWDDEKLVSIAAASSSVSTMVMPGAPVTMQLSFQTRFEIRVVLEHCGCPQGIACQCNREQAEAYRAAATRKLDLMRETIRKIDEMRFEDK